MIRLRALWRLLRAVLHMLHGAAVLAVVFPRASQAERERLLRWWATKLLRVLGIGLVIDGVAPRPGGVLIIANHVSWLDIMAITAVRPVRFISKIEVGRWPLVGWLVTRAGTLYIERGNRRDTVRVMHHMAQALQQGDALAVFPEGTTSDGHGVLPFHGNLLQAAISTATPIQPIALRYSDPHHRVSPAVAYVGDTSLLQSLWWVVCASGVQVHVSVLDAHASAHADRRALALHLHACVAQRLSTG